MWLALRTLLAAEAAGSATSLYIAGGIAGFFALAAAYLAMRGTFKTADVTREQALDAAVDKDRQALRDDNERLRARCDALLAERDLAREQLARLRLDVFIKLHKDPDAL